MNKVDKKLFRKEFHNYNSPGIYFITICTRDRKKYFGEVQNSKIILNKSGQIVNEVIEEVLKHFKYTKVLNHVVMPNHVHILLELEPPYYLEGSKLTKDDKEIKKYPYEDIGTDLRRQHQKLFVIVGQLKSVVTKMVRKSEFQSFMWQPRFYESFISDQKQVHKLADYVDTNPYSWSKDKFFIK